jgi:hypothetical protein
MTNHAIISLSNTESTRLTPNGVHSGLDITVQNINESAYIYLGGEGSLNPEDFGYRLAPGAAWSVELPGTDSLYAVADTDGAYVAILQTGLEG